MGSGHWKCSSKTKLEEPQVSKIPRPGLLTLVTDDDSDTLIRELVHCHCRTKASKVSTRAVTQKEIHAAACWSTCCCLLLEAGNDSSFQMMKLLVTKAEDIKSPVTVLWPISVASKAWRNKPLALRDWNSKTLGLPVYSWSLHLLSDQNHFLRWWFYIGVNVQWVLAKKYDLICTL